jgi:cytochrome oxidase Cu insertion factor (SCO1/SenC/PrrC family)
MTSGRLAALSVLVALGAIAAYALLLRVPLVRNHPEGYVVAFAVAAGLLLVGGAWFDFVAARVPVAPSVLRVGERPPDFRLTDASGRTVTLSDYRGQKPVVLVFYRGHW